MDSAVQVVNMAAAMQVTAREVDARFHGQIPASVRFYCPFCSRPVIASAMGRRHGRRRGSHQPRIVSPHFKHRRNDEWAHDCEAYHATSSTEQDGLVLPLLMFLRREPGSSDRFNVEIALRRRGLTGLRRSLTDADAVTVDGRAYLLPDLLRRHRTIPLPNPLYNLEKRILVPRQWQMNLGRAQNSTGIMIFSDAFGGNGGRRLPMHSALRTDCAYFIVAIEERLRGARNLFDRMERVGRIAGDDRLRVYSVLVSAASTRKGDVDDWLGGYGYCLSDFDRSAQLMWPPSLRVWGVDEPLFRRSSPTYRFPYMRSAGTMNDRIVRRELIPDDANARPIGLIGFGTNPDVESRSASYCVFFKPNPRMSWTTAYVGPRYPEDLHPFDGHADDVMPGENGNVTPPDDRADGDGKQDPDAGWTPGGRSRPSLSRGMEIALRRLGVEKPRQPQGQPRSMTIARYRGKDN
ncbi:hypothetical protein G1C96_0258 [Bifidobacterium sp. DSM 109958]|uniref:Uncharacterized protein n=1 Tax=Bifidobacterium moraviense TaxID=2675323 RepID=A0A7Y0F092_9BIFI|nr:hypothetical protein [Bifidobacterium sp. DSM 109958]NMM99680.1 hypothetical protein [Bifidobacterium sp. DSM 109958]